MTTTGTTSEMCTVTENQPLRDIVKSDEQAAGDGEKGTPYTVYFRAWNRVDPGKPVSLYKFDVGVAAEKNNCLEEPSKEVNLLPPFMNLYLPNDSSLVALGTCIYSIGGCDGGSDRCPTNLVYFYNSTKHEEGWVPLKPMKYPRCKQGYAVLVDTDPKVLAVNGKIYVMGGLSEEEYAKPEIVNKWAEVYDPKTGEWSDVKVVCVSDGYEKNRQPLFAFLFKDVNEKRECGLRDYYFAMRIEALGSYEIFLATNRRHSFILDTRENVLRRKDDTKIATLSPYACVIMKETDGLPDEYHLDWCTGVLSGGSTESIYGGYRSNVSIYDGGCEGSFYPPSDRKFFSRLRTLLRSVQSKNDLLQIHVLFKEEPFVVHYKHIEYQKVNLVKGDEGSISADLVGNIKSHKTYKLASAQEVYLGGGVVLPFVVSPNNNTLL